MLYIIKGTTSRRKKNDKEECTDNGREILTADTLILEDWHYNERKGWIRKEVTVPSLYPEGYLASTVCGTGRVDFVLASSISERRANDTTNTNA